MIFCFFFFFKQKTAYEITVRDWSSDVCSSDLDEFRNKAEIAKLCFVHQRRIELEIPGRNAAGVEHKDFGRRPGDDRQQRSIVEQAPLVPQPRRADGFV